MPSLLLLTGVCRLEHVEGTVTHLSETLDELKARFAAFLPTSSTSTIPSTGSGETDYDSAFSQPKTHADQSPGLQPVAQYHNSERQLTVPHRVLLWPFLYSFLTESPSPLAYDLARISEEGTKWFVRRELTKHPRSLPGSGRSPSAMPITPDEAQGDSFSAFTAERTNAYTEAYFRTLQCPSSYSRLRCICPHHCGATLTGRLC